MGVTLSPWPNWNQNADPTADARPDENAANNCGPESVAEVVWYITGVSLPADYIHDVEYGEGYIGYTDAAHLTDFLNNQAAIPTKDNSTQGTAPVRSLVEDALSRGWPVIVLFYWDLVNLTGGHWCPVVAFDETSCTRSNPWTGTQETFSWADFERYQQDNTAIVCCRRRAIDTNTTFVPTPAPPSPTGGAGAPAHSLVGYAVVTRHFLRAAPSPAAAQVVLLTEGEALAPGGGWTTHWRKVRTARGEIGWAYAPNITPVYK